MEFLKAADPDKKVTDPVMLAALTGQGIDKDGVELSRDYAPRSRGKGYSPYSKLYRDLNSGKQFAVISGLPMVDAYGQSHELEWRDKSGVIENGNNIFHAIVQSGGTRLIALSDQPNGVRKDGEVVFCPQLFVGGSEIQPLSDMPVLLETDPANDNYHYNVLEWDYGVCRRRMRIIEGRFLGSWVFLTNPGGDVLIKYNQRGGFRLRLQYARSDDEEYIPEEYLTGRDYPVVVADSATFYPDANPETTSVDGRADRATSNETWATIRAGAGTNAYPSTASDQAFFYGSGSVADRFHNLGRSIALFDTSSLPDEAAISGAVLSLYGNAKLDGNYASPNLNVYASTPASNTNLVAADYSQVGSTAFCDTPVTYTGFNTSGYNDFTLNAGGIAAISKTGVSKFGFRNANYDVANYSPPWVYGQYTYFTAYFAEQGAGYKPKLVVAYTTGESKTSSDSGTGLEAIVVRTLEIAEQGSGEDVGLSIADLSGGDGGSGTEIGGLVKALTGSDTGSATDALKVLTGKGGTDLALRNYSGQVGIPHKEVNL